MYFDREEKGLVFKGHTTLTPLLLPLLDVPEEAVVTTPNKNVTLMIGLVLCSFSCESFESVFFKLC